MAKTALITGASQGLGACMAKTLAADGFNIAINCLGERERENGGNQVAEACRALGVEAECFLCDVSDFTACEAMAKAVKDRFGTIDVLVNNAGITKDGLLVQMSEEQFDVVTRVNYKSVFNMMRHVGIIGMTKTGAKELGKRGITVNAVAPGFIQTPMTEVLGEEYKEAILKQIGLQRLGQPEDVANAVAFLASDRASYISGQVLEVSGCLSM